MSPQKVKTLCGVCPLTGLIARWALTGKGRSTQKDVLHRRRSTQKDVLHRDVLHRGRSTQRTFYTKDVLHRRRSTQGRSTQGRSTQETFYTGDVLHSSARRRAQGEWRGQGWFSERSG